MISHATRLLNHAESVSVKEDDALVLRDRMRKLQRHRPLHSYPLAAAHARRGEAGQPAKNVFFDPRACRDLLVGVRPHPFCNLTVTGCGFCTFPHERYHAGRAGVVVEHVGAGVRRPARPPAATESQSRGRASLWPGIPRHHREARTCGVPDCGFRGCDRPTKWHEPRQPERGSAVRRGLFLWNHWS